MLEEIKKNIVDALGLSDVSKIVFENSTFSIASFELSLRDVFFDSEWSDDDIANYISSFKKNNSHQPGVVIVSDGGGHEYSFYKVDNYHQNLREGVYKINSADGLVYTIFAGSFDGATEPDLTDDKVILFAMLLLEHGALASNAAELHGGWSGIYKAIGPFVCVDSKSYSHDALIPYGFLKKDSVNNGAIYTHDFKEQEIISNSAIAKKTRCNIPEQAVSAYSHALKTKTTVDLLFINLHRVFEVLYAWGLKEYISGIHVNDIYSTISGAANKGKSLSSESEMMKYVVTLSNVPLPTSLTSAVIRDLYPGISLDDISKVEAIKQWLNGKGKGLDHSLLAGILYCVRNSLVHSKLDSSTRYLMGPYSARQLTSLEILVEVQKTIIYEILYG